MSCISDRCFPTYYDVYYSNLKLYSILNHNYTHNPCNRSGGAYNVSFSLQAIVFMIDNSGGRINHRAYEMICKIPMAFS